jgi:hypothetical protein
MAWSHTQTLLSADGTATSSTTIAITLGATVSASALVVGTVFWGSDTININGVTDDKGNTYSVIDSQHSTGDGASAAQFYKEGISNGPITITATFSATTPFRRICVSEYAGIATSSAIDVHNVQWRGTFGLSANGVTSLSATTTANDDLIRGSFFDTSGNANVLSAGTSPAFNQRAAGTSGNIVPCVVEDFLQTTAGAITATATQTVNDNMICSIATFKIASVSDTLFGSKMRIMM